MVSVVVLAGAMNLTGCKSDPAPSISKTDLISKTWKLTALTANGADTYVDLQPCEKDNLYSFTKSGNYTNDEGATKCDSTDPQVVETLKWSFLQNETVLKFLYPDGSTVNFTITQLTTTTLKLTYTLNVNNVNITLVSTYTAV